MTTLLEDAQALRSRLMSELPDGTPRSDGIAALDITIANVRLVEIVGEKAQATALAKVDVDSLHPTERAAWLGVVRAKASAAEDARREAERAEAEATALAAAEAAKTP